MLDLHLYCGELYYGVGSSRLFSVGTRYIMTIGQESMRRVVKGCKRLVASVFLFHLYFLVVFLGVVQHRDFYFCW